MKNSVKAGDTISVHYTGKFDDGEVFDSSEGRTPLKFTVGADQVIPGFDNAVLAMVPGNKKTFTIKPEDAYGARSDDFMIDVPRSQVPTEMELELGMAVQMSDQSGNPVLAIVAGIGEDTVTLDANHPLAGRTLIFDIELVETGLEPDHSGCSSTGGCSSCGGSCSE